MSSLFTPYKLGPVTLRNRTVRSAAFESMGRHFGPTEQLKEYHVSVARGGVGMTTLAYAAVCRSGLSFDKQLWLRPEIVPGLRGITDAVHREGGRVDKYQPQRQRPGGGGQQLTHRQSTFRSLLSSTAVAAASRALL